MVGNIFKRIKSIITFVYNKTQFILLIVFLSFLITLLNPVWEGINEGFQEVWTNIRHTWIIVIFKNIMKVLLIIFFWFWTLGITGMLSFLICMIPSYYFNKFLSNKYPDEHIRYIPLPPKDLKEWVSLIFNLLVFFIPFILLFVNFFWSFIKKIDYTIIN